MITDLFASDATANLPWQACIENLTCVSMSSVETPMTVAPSAVNFSVASANSCASTEQPDENAAGKKYSTTGPFASDWLSEKLYCLPASAACVVKSGALSPMSSAAQAEPAIATEPSSPTKIFFIIDSLRVLSRDPRDVARSFSRRVRYEQSPLPDAPSPLGSAP